MITMPSNGIFKVKCTHCGDIKTKTPEQITKGKEMHLYECVKCHNLTLIRVNLGSASLFKVE